MLLLASAQTSELAGVAVTVPLLHLHGIKPYDKTARHSQRPPAPSRTRVFPTYPFSGAQGLSREASGVALALIAVVLLQARHPLVILVPGPSQDNAHGHQIDNLCGAETRTHQQFRAWLVEGKRSSLGGTGRSVTERVAMAAARQRTGEGHQKGRLNMWLVWLRARYSHSYCPPPRLITMLSSIQPQRYSSSPRCSRGYDGRTAPTPALQQTSPSQLVT